jgi:hypothetical protein
LLFAFALALAVPVRAGALPFRWRCSLPRTP